MSGWRITRGTAEGTNLVDKTAPVVRVRTPSGELILLTSSSYMNGKPATDCTDEEIITAIAGDESVYA